MLFLRSLGAFYLLLSLYYARFFLLRQEETTLLQIVTLWCAAGWLLLRAAPAEAGRTIWFHGWRPASWPGWALLFGAAAAAIAVFVVMDRDSHSVSDTLNRIVPTYALLAALVLRLRLERTLWSQ